MTSSYDKIKKFLEEAKEWGMKPFVSGFMSAFGQVTVAAIWLWCVRRYSLKSS
jgi:hypothetical protein